MTRAYVLSISPETTPAPYVLVADAGAYALSGTNAVTSIDRTMGAVSGLYTYTGTTSFKLEPMKLAANAGSYGLSGTDIGLSGINPYAYHYSFDSAQDQADPNAAGGSAEDFGNSGSFLITHRSDGTWNPSNANYLRCRLRDDTSAYAETSGIYLDLYSTLQTALTDPAIWSFGWIERIGPTYFTNVPYGPKFIYFEVSNDGGVSRNHSATPTPYHYLTSGCSPEKAAIELTASPGGSNRAFEGGIIAWPDDPCYALTWDYYNHDDGTEWVYYEVTHNPYTGKLSMSVYTRDGTVAAQDLVDSASVATSADHFKGFHYVNYYELQPYSGDANSYIDISDVYVGNGFMGPPTGFVTG